MVSPTCTGVCGATRTVTGPAAVCTTTKVSAPVGSTSSIVALCFQNAGEPIPKTIAGLLMAGLISDTLNLSSPTTTATDVDLHTKLFAEAVRRLVA